MLQYIIKRILLVIPVVILISFVVFYIIQLPPGDYVSSYSAKMSAAGDVMTQAEMDEMRPIWAWTVRYMSNILCG